MAMKRMTRSGMASRSSVGALAVLLIAAFAVGSAFAFTTPGTEVTILNPIGVISGAQTEQIHVNGSTTPTSVYMGPYKIPISGQSMVELMMCFNAGAAALSGPALATDRAGAIEIFKSEAKINMISWLASQWHSTTSGLKADIDYNANINKAMWEIMADFGKYELNVTGESATAGTFFLNKGDGDIDAVNNLLSQALGHVTDTIYDANFLIPGSMATDGKTWVYDATKQPFVSQPVPEPGTLLLLGSGLVGLGLHGWRKRSKAQQ
jgi:hypothetical protein